MRRILITGATGFLGGCFLSQIIQKYDVNEILILARPSDGKNALIRVKENLGKFETPVSLLDSLKDFNIIIGDLSDPQGFLNDDRLDEVTDVVNCAAIASFGNNPLIWKVNVDGTFAFAERMSGVVKLNRFIHVGTAMACLPESGEDVAERRLSPDQEGHIVDYTKSKATIEYRLTHELKSLPVILARPSIIVGHSTLGCKPSCSIFWVFEMALSLKKFMCNLEDRIDVIPVDYCAEMLQVLLQHHVKKGSNEVIHISAGRDDSVTFKEIDDSFSYAKKMNSIAPHYKQVDFGYFVRKKNEFDSLIGPCNNKLILRAINLYGQFSELNVTFDNGIIKDLSGRRPPKFTSYIAKCVDSTRGLKISDMMRSDFK